MEICVAHKFNLQRYNNIFSFQSNVLVETEMKSFHGREGIVFEKILIFVMRLKYGCI